MGNFCLINLDHQENIKPYLENQPLLIRVVHYIFANYIYLENSYELFEII